MRNARPTNATVAVASILLLLASTPSTPARPAAGLDLPVGPPRPAAPLPSHDRLASSVLVTFRSDAPAKLPAWREMGLEPVTRLERLGVEKLSLPDGADLDQVLARLRALPGVEHVEPNGPVYTARVPNDPFYDGVDGRASDMQKWIYGGTSGFASVDAEAGWDVTIGRPDVVVAVIDSGVSPTDPNLASRIWRNPNEVPGNGVDDDDNGYVDDLRGWDFYFDDNDPAPDLGNDVDDDGFNGRDDQTPHGTFVANCAAGGGDDGYGVSGAAWGCTVMPLKVFTDDGESEEFFIAAAIDYAAENGADVINLSIVAPTPSATVRAAIARAAERDCVVVSSAGNANTSEPGYPASEPGVLSVGASDHAFLRPDYVQAFGPRDPAGRAPYSQFGPRAVDVVAPGTVFGSSVVNAAFAAADPRFRPGDAYAYPWAGTSFACPIVAGLAALIVSRDRDLNGARTLSAAEIVAIIEGTARDLPDDPNDAPDGGADWDNHGIVDFRAAIDAVTIFVPIVPPSSLTATKIKKKKVALAWRDDSADEDGFEVAVRENGVWRRIATLPAGSTSFVAAGLARRTAYAFGVRAARGGRFSDYAGPLAVTTK
jgi:subtilisin family serine protease